MYLESGNSYNIKFDIDTLTIYDSINVSENKKVFKNYSKSIEIAEDEVVVSNVLIEEKVTIEKQPMVINNDLSFTCCFSSISNDANSKSLESLEKASKKTDLVKTYHQNNQSLRIILIL